MLSITSPPLIVAVPDPAFVTETVIGVEDLYALSFVKSVRVMLVNSILVIT